MDFNRSYVTNNNTYDRNDQQWIVVHNTGNFRAGADASAHARAQASGNLQTSVHWYVDDSGTAYQAAPYNRGCWHVGVQYGSGDLFGTVNNRNSIGVEMCVQEGYDYEAAFQRTAETVRLIMQETGIDADHVVQHWDVCRKDCPQQIREHGDWDRFKSLLTDSAPAEPAEPSEASDSSFRVKVNINNLNIRSGAGTNTAVVGQTGVGVFTIVDTTDGPGSASGWGKLLSGAGWVSLDYCHRI